MATMSAIVPSSAARWNTAESLIDPFVEHFHHLVTLAAPGKAYRPGRCLRFFDFNLFSNELFHQRVPLVIGWSLAHAAVGWSLAHAAVGWSLAHAVVGNAMLFTNKHLLTLDLDILPGPSQIDTFSNISTISGPRPIFHSLNKAVLHRIVMNVIHMALQISLIPNLMLPEPALPNAPLAFATA